MQIQFRRNPKTEDGWFKRIAIALLSGLGTFLVLAPVAFFIFLNHFESAYPKDTQNLLSAITASVVTGLALAGFVGMTVLIVLLLLGKMRPAARVSA